ncbi:ABC transporter permease [Bdellovibrio sp. SKB1291214]|uniref:MlaE family ABC transporter permease n=1 Tax=Bdellovibrio sp. SKB1291214 TaxID=1732569 RepID=UPI000B51A11B|nr:ABC transporter permease [Bdellovibrio sp. SKB1291214]UYL08187.1 ABC transporter permease [Bdellovibrio sp. SKB1291214]
MNSLFLQIDSLGRFVTRNVEYTWRVLLMVYLSLRATVLDQTQGMREIVRVISAQIYFTGWQALPLVSVLALTSGSVLVLQSLSNLSMFGGTQMIGQFLIVGILREVGPLLVALVVTARSGTAVASELGNMRANREIEALEVMGINPLSYIVFPRVVGGVISMLCLAFYFNFVALIGGFFVTKFIQDMPFAFYAESLMTSFAMDDFLIFLLKNSFSGMIIFVVSCYQGLSVKKSPTEVPQVTTQAVVNSIIFVVVFNLIVTALFYLNQLRNLGVI